MEPKTAAKKIEDERKRAIRLLSDAVLAKDAEAVGYRCGVTATTIARWITGINQIPLTKVEFVIREFQP